METNDIMYALTFAYEIELSPCLVKLCEWIVLYVLMYAWTVASNIIQIYGDGGIEMFWFLIEKSLVTILKHQDHIMHWTCGVNVFWLPFFVAIKTFWSPFFVASETF
jgi:hypothetical protein